MLNALNSYWQRLLIMLLSLTAAIVISGCSGLSSLSVSDIEQSYEAEAPTDRVELTKEIQEMLKGKGFYDGAIDGIGGPNTLSALTAYQKKWGLASTKGINAKAYAQLSVWDTTRKFHNEKRKDENIKAKKTSKINSVRFISPEQTKTCKYINQIVATSPLSHFGGIEKTEEWAREELKVKAADKGANGLRVSDRIFDKGRGGNDKTRLTLYGDIYKCSQW